MPQKKLRSFRSVTKSKRRIATAAKATRGYKVAGTTVDGIRILRAKVKPNHFTSRQIRAAISEVEKGRTD
jgi:predicted P-loop ATPase